MLGNNACNFIVLHLVLFLSYQTRSDSSDSQMSDSQMPRGMRGMFLRLVSLHDIISHYSPDQPNKPVCCLYSWLSLFAPLSFSTSGIYFYIECFLLFLYQFTPLWPTSSVEQDTLLETHFGFPSWLSLEVVSPLFFYGCSIYEGSGMISPLELAFMYHVYPQGNCKPQEGRIISSISFLSHLCQDIH